MQLAPKWSLPRSSEFLQQTSATYEKGKKIPSASRAAQVARKLGLPEKLLIQVAIQDELRKQKFKYRVSLPA